MLFELSILLALMFTYCTFILMAVFGIYKLNKTKLKVSHSHYNYSFVSIIVSIKNESVNAKAFIHEIEKQTYSKEHFELIIIDDFSNDNSFEIFKEILEESDINYKIFRKTSHFGKKRNVSEAINKAIGTIIITTDADVVYRDANWLTTIVNYFQKNNPSLLIMPIDYILDSGILSNFQMTENLALTGITAGFCGIHKPFLCNGSNLAFTKSAFNSVGGYSNHIDVSSGEDVFLLEDLKRIDIKAIHYSWQQELIVKTKTVNFIFDLLNQRIRWAKKFKQNPNVLNFVFGFILICASLIYVFLPIAILNQSLITPYLLIFCCSKLILDFLLLFLTSKFFGKTKHLLYLFPFEFLYWLYAILVGFGALFIKPTWKGVKVK